MNSVVRFSIKDCSFYLSSIKSFPSVPDDEEVFFEALVLLAIGRLSSHGCVLNGGA